MTVVWYDTYVKNSEHKTELFLGFAVFAAAMALAFYSLETKNRFEVNCLAYIFAAIGIGAVGCYFTAVSQLPDLRNGTVLGLIVLMSGLLLAGSAAAELWKPTIYLAGKSLYSLFVRSLKNVGNSRIWTLMNVEEFDETRHALGVIASEVRLSPSMPLWIQDRRLFQKLGRLG